MVGSLTVSTTLVHVVLGIHCTQMEGTVKIVSYLFSSLLFMHTLWYLCVAYTRS